MNFNKEAYKKWDLSYKAVDEAENWDKAVAGENGYMWPLSLVPVSVGMRYREHGARHWRNTSLNWNKKSAWEIKIKMTQTLIYLSVWLGCNSCAFCCLFYHSFLFSSGFGDLCSHAFGPTKEPNWFKWMNKDRKLPSPQKNSSQTLGDTSFSERSRGISPKPKWPQRDVWELAGGKKSAEDAKETRILPIFLESGVCKWRNWPRRKWDAEYNAQVRWWMGNRAMTTQPPRLHQSQVFSPTRRRGGHGVGGHGQWERHNNMANNLFYMHTL